MKVKQKAWVYSDYPDEILSLIQQIGVFIHENGKNYAFLPSVFVWDDNKKDEITLCEFKDIDAGVKDEFKKHLEIGV